MATSPKAPPQTSCSISVARQQPYGPVWMAMSGSAHQAQIGNLLLTSKLHLLRGGHDSGNDRANGEFAVLELRTRPTSVAGPVGPLTIDDLPAPTATYWVARRKAELLAAIDGGLIGLEEAGIRYRLSGEELQSWRRTLERAGIPGLRVRARGMRATGG